MSIDMAPKKATPRGDTSAAGTVSSGKAASIIGPLAVFLVLMGVWSVLSVTVYAHENYLVPRPWTVLQSGVENRAMLLSASWTTLVESLAGFALAIVLGGIGAVIMSQSRVLERGLYPWAIVLQTVPVVAVAPIVVLWFKYGTKSVVIISLVLALFPILNNTLLGLKSVNQNHRDLFRMHTRGRIVRFVKLELPGATPSIIAGLKVSAGLSVVGAIVGEFLIGSGGSHGGLGVKVIFSQAQLDTPLLFAEVAAATILGMLFFVIVNYIGYLFLHTWHESAVGKE